MGGSGEYHNFIAKIPFLENGTLHTNKEQNPIKMGQLILNSYVTIKLWSNYNGETLQKYLGGITKKLHFLRKIW